MLNRRQFLTASALGSLSCSNGTSKRPNVLFLIVDDMNDYGFYGPSAVSRPLISTGSRIQL